MKRSKKLAFLLAFLGVLCVGTILLTRMEEHEEQIRAAGEIVLEIPAEKVTALDWTYGDTSLAFHREETWLYDADESFPVSEEAISELLEPFAAFGVSFVIEDVTDESVYGLDDPTCEIRITAAEQSWTVKLGDFSKMDEERYVSIGDGNVYLARVDPMEQFEVGLEDMIRHDPSLNADEVRQIRFEGAESYTIVRQEDSSDAYCADDLYFTRRNGETVPLDTGRVEDYIRTLSALDLSDYVTYNATEEELAAYGLNAPELTVTVEYVTEEEEGTYTLSVCRDPQELAAAEEAEANDGEPEEVTAYVRVGDSQIVYRVSEYNSNSLRAVSFNELRHREVLTADFEQVTQLDITLEGKQYTIYADGVDEDDVRVWKYGETEIDMEKLQTELESLDVEYSADFTGDQPDGKKEISLRVQVDRETAPTVKIDLYRHDGEHCLAVVDGTPLAFVSRRDVVDLVEAVNAIVLNSAD